MKFKDYYSLSEIIKSNLTKAGFLKPTDIQYKAIPSILRGEDVLAVAQTGTGKTAAFAIPVIQKVMELNNAYRSEGIKCVVMVPTRELALQVSEVFQKIGRGTGVATFCVFGGVEQAPQIAKLEKGIDILVTTPGRMFDLSSQGFIRLNRVRILILDEADRMLDPGFIKDIRDVTERVPPKRQTLFFSATIDENIKRLAYSLVTNPIRIQVSPKDPVAKNIRHAVSFVEMDDKRFFLERIIKSNPDDKIMVFVRTKVRAERVVKALDRLGVPAIAIHGDKDQAERFEMLDRFRSGSVRVLISTDVGARGIDIPDIDMVVNYDLPEKAENYVHRVGRTGRGVRKGQAISFCSEDEKGLLAEIEAYITKPVNRIDISTEAHRDIVEASAEYKPDLQAVLKEIEQYENRKKRRKKN
ncbi:DEAD/DEAH box helicase [Ravibacter arvi]